jgi:hypothetical protein
MGKEEMRGKQTYLPVLLIVVELNPLNKLAVLLLVLVLRLLINHLNILLFLSRLFRLLTATSLLLRLDDLLLLLFLLVGRLLRRRSLLRLLRGGGRGRLLSASIRLRSLALALGLLILDARGAALPPALLLRLLLDLLLVRFRCLGSVALA